MDFVTAEDDRTDAFALAQQRDTQNSAMALVARNFPGFRKFVAVSVMNGSNKPANSPFFNGNGQLQIWARTGTQLTKAAELPIGRWCQGIAWSGNGKTLLAQCMVEEEINVIRFSGLAGRSLQRVGSIKTKGGPAGIRTAEP